MCNAYATEVARMAAQTVGFAVADDDRAMLDRLVERYGHGNRSEFLRVAMKVMAAEERAERLRDLQARAHSQVGRVFTSNEVNDLVRKVLKARD
jgi:Arc/MetJ-type ribon-helix-helix transcriptional regulator